jgi:glycosyltransferase involved in cell wall biosynthesis
VLVLAQYPAGMAPGQRFRFEQYIVPLAELGIELEPRAVLDERAMATLYQPGHTVAKVRFALRGVVERVRDVLAARRYDLAFVYRAVYPVGPSVFERALARLGVPYVFDFDDAIYIPHTSRANWFVRPLKYTGKTKASAAAAALVTTGNAHLAAWARQHNDNVRVLPTTIDTGSYGFTPVDQAKTGALTVGWTGSPTTIPHLETVASVLAQLQREEGIGIRVIGDRRFGIAGAEVRATDWKADSEVADLRDFDIGIMPLPDDEWSRGKCGLKALQCMALGIPTVMSPVGVNTDIAQGGAAALASTPEDWVRVLRELIHDPVERARLGVEGRKRVVESYSVEANVGVWADALRSVSG